MAEGRYLVRAPTGHEIHQSERAQVIRTAKYPSKIESEIKACSVPAVERGRSTTS